MGKDKTSLVFTGDIGFDSYFNKKWEDPEVISAEVLDFLHSGDHVVANVEGAVMNQADAKDGGGKGRFFHTMDPAAVPVLKRMQADIWNLANNHTLDGGRIGIESTLAFAKQAGAQTIGAGMNVFDAMKPVILDEAGGIGLIGLGFMETCVRATAQAPGSFAFDEVDRIETVVKKIKEQCRWCVIVVHAGEEFSSMPAPYTRDLFMKYLSFGADVVVAHHPHVPRNFETFEGGKKAIFYSLGNFIFDTDYQRAQLNTDKGVLLKLNFTETGFSYEGFGTKIVRGEEHVTAGPLPEIFTDICAEEYEKLIPLSAKAFLKAERKKKIFLKAEEWQNATEEKWQEYYEDFSAKGRIRHLQHDLLDYQEVAAKAESGEYETSSLEGVKAYLKAQL